MTTKRKVIWVAAIAIAVFASAISFVVLFSDGQLESVNTLPDPNSISVSYPPEFDTHNFQMSLPTLTGRFTIGGGRQGLFVEAVGKLPHKGEKKSAKNFSKLSEKEIVDRYKDVFNRYFKVNYGRVPGREFNIYFNNVRLDLRSFVGKTYDRRYGPTPDKNPSLSKFMNKRKEYVDSHPFRISSLEQQFAPLKAGYDSMTNDPWIKGVLRTTVYGYLDEEILFIRLKNKYRVLYTDEATFTMLGTDDATYDLIPESLFPKRPEGHRYCKVISTPEKYWIESGWKGKGKVVLVHDYPNEGEIKKDSPKEGSRVYKYVDEHGTHFTNKPEPSTKEERDHD